MDSDDDDIYPEYEGANGRKGTNEVKMEEPEDGEEEGEEIEEDSDVLIHATRSYNARPLFSLTTHRTMSTSSSTPKKRSNQNQDRKFPPLTPCSSPAPGPAQYC